MAFPGWLLSFRIMLSQLFSREIFPRRQVKSNANGVIHARVFKSFTFLAVPFALTPAAFKTCQGFLISASLLKLLPRPSLAPESFHGTLAAYDGS